MDSIFGEFHGRLKLFLKVPMTFQTSHRFQSLYKNFHLFFVKQVLRKGLNN